MRTILALLLVVACLSVLADDCPAIQSFTANDVQTGEPVTFTWSYTGGAPQTQTLTGHDFEAPVVLSPDARSYTYTPSKPGEKHAQLAAISACGTVAHVTKYHVKQCNVVAAPIVVDQSSVAPGGVVTASIALQPGQTATWDVVNGTASATSGASIQVTAGAAGPIAIGAWVSRGNSCAVRVSANVDVVEACAIPEPQIYSPSIAVADSYFGIYVPTPPGATVTLTVTGAAQVYWNDGVYLDILTPASGSFTVNIAVSNGTCTRTFSRTWEVGPCTAAVTVSEGESGSCGASTAVLEFTGVAPFQGQWSDGEYFYTNETRIERALTTPGVYTVAWFGDATYCQGTITGSATSGASFPPPNFTIDPFVGSSYYATVACTGQERVANLAGSVPDGAQLEWSVTNATILSGQGTNELHFVAGTAGPISVNATLRDAQGCSQTSTDSSLLVYGQPAFTVTVEPSTIPLGGTAIITVTNLVPFTGGTNVTSSLGDQIIPLGGTGDTARWEYRSTSTGGPAIITVTENTPCLLTTTVEIPVTIDAGNPVQAAALVRAIGSSCSDYAAFAEFTGVAPFSGTWSDGTTFNDIYPYSIRYPSSAGTYTLVEFQDANGPGTITGSATFEFTRLPQPAFEYNVESTCPNSIVTATLTTPLPEGAIANWYVYSGELLSGQGTSSIQIRAGDSGWIGAGVSISAPGACSLSAISKNLEIRSYVQQPLFDTYGVYVGGTTQFDVYLDPNTATWGFENSFGDTMEIVGNPQPNVHTIRYTSTHGFGDSMIRIYGTTTCGLAFENTRAMSVLPPAPTATLTSTPGASCGSDVTVTFTGTAPFSGTWWDGQTFTTNDYTLTRHVTDSSWIYVYGVSDFYGGNASSPGITPEMKQLDPVPLSGPSQICIGAQDTVTAQLPEGWQILWRVAPNPADMSYGMRIVSGETSASVVVEGVSAGWAALNPVITTPEGCVRYESYYINVPAPQGNPVITLPVTSIKAGEGFDFTVAFDGNYQSLGWESSNGDGVWNLGQNGMTFTLHYQSYNGPGTTTIRAYGTTVCGAQVEATATLVIEP